MCGHVGDRHGIGDHGIGDLPVLGDGARRERVGDTHHLGQLAQLRQCGFDGVTVRGGRQRLASGDREHGLCLSSPRPRELLVQQVQRLLGLCPGNREGIRGRLLHTDGKHRQTGNDHDPDSEDHAAVSKTRLADPIEQGTHDSSKG